MNVFKSALRITAYLLVGVALLLVFVGFWVMTPA